MIEFQILREACKTISTKDWNLVDEEVWSEAIASFEKGISQWAELKTHEVFNSLIELFDDACMFPELMYGLVHALETYPDEIYVRGILRNISEMLKKSPFWLDVLVNRLLNCEKSFQIFRKNMHLAPKDALLALFDIMDRESPHHRETVVALRAELLNAAQD